jgi:hypothetical protein
MGYVGSLHRAKKCLLGTIWQAQQHGPEQCNLTRIISVGFFAHGAYKIFCACASSRRPREATMPVTLVCFRAIERPSRYRRPNRHCPSSVSADCASKIFGCRQHSEGACTTDAGSSRHHRQAGWQTGGDARSRKWSRLRPNKLRRPKPLRIPKKAIKMALPPTPQDYKATLWIVFEVSKTGLR